MQFKSSSFDHKQPKSTSVGFLIVQSSFFYFCFYSYELFQILADVIFWLHDKQQNKTQQVRMRGDEEKEQNMQIMRKKWKKKETYQRWSFFTYIYMISKNIQWTYNPTNTSQLKPACTCPKKILSADENGNQWMSAEHFGLHQSSQNVRWAWIRPVTVRSRVEMKQAEPS